MGRLSLWAGCALGVIIVALLAALNGAVASRADAALSAHGGGPELPRQEANSPTWRVASQGFESLYPNGYRFTLDASSTAGPIERARVEWTNRPNHVREGETIRVTRAEGIIDPATGRITATWTPTDTTAVPPWVEVEYRWRLRDADDNEYVTEPQVAEYADPSHDWHRTETDDVVVFSTGLPGDIGDLIAQAMDAQRAQYEAGWGALLPYRPRVILFGDLNTWLEWQTGHQDTTGLGVIRVGVTSGDWGGTVQVLFGGERDLAYGTVLHEIEHLYQSEFLRGRQRFTPGWFFEGDATFYQLDDTPGIARQHVEHLIRRDALPVLLQDTGPTIGGARALDGYYIGYTFFAWLDARGGIEAHRALMDLLASDMPFTEAIERVTGLSIEETERAWRAWLGASPVVPTLIPTPTPLPFWPSPTPMTFGK